MNEKTAGQLPTVHRISHGKLRVALLRCPGYDATIVLLNSWWIIPFTLKNIQNLHFPKLYQCFCYIENPADFIKCLEAFYAIRDNVVWTSRLILDELVKHSYFGDDDKWYFFFHEMINNMAEQVFYDPAKIDYSVAPESQTKFEQVLSSPIRHLEKYTK